MEASTKIISLIRRECARPAPPPINALAEEIRRRYGDAVKAILFYGSCFRRGENAEGIVDLYLVVDNYRHAYASLFHAFLNKLLPPNVFYLEVPYKKSIIRAKYTVFSFTDFQLGTSMRWFHSYLWSRVSQPMGIVYSVDDHVTEQVYTAMAHAVITFVSRTLPCMPKKFTSRDLWSKGFALTYSTELRAERKDKLIALYDFAPRYYEKLTLAAMDEVQFLIKIAKGISGIVYSAQIPAPVRIASRISWNIRRIQGKFLSFLRLLKGLCTFDAGLDYVLWKIERHSGIFVEIDPRIRRIPILGTGVLFWRLYRRGAFR
ncbi:MAG: hypothetical protein ACKVE4_05735 [Dissulfuribacterales bacterium]